jgi:hypothetical protein
MARRTSSLLLAAGIAAASGFGALIGIFWGFGLKCDDSCSSGPRWREDPDASQWHTFGTVGIAGFVCALVFLAAVALRSRALALGALAVWAVLAGAFMVLFRDSGLTSNVDRGWTAVAVVLLGGVAAVALAGSRAQPAR